MIISGLYVYPIKSCAGVRVRRSLVSNYGLAHDRRFMVIDADTEIMISQREEPRLALIKTGMNGGMLFVHADGMSRLELSLYHFAGRNRQVEVHGQRFWAMDQGDNAASWFTEYLGKPCRIVAVPEDSMRSKQVNGIQMTISCHDSSSLHVITEESLADAGFSSECFRPNIVISGAKPYEEDDWHNLMIGQSNRVVGLFARKKTARCSMIGKDALAALATYRRDYDKKEIYFGMYFFPYLPGSIGEGDIVAANAG